MKFMKLISVVMLAFVCLLLSCDEDVENDNEVFNPTSEFYIQFKANGKLKTYEAANLPVFGGSDMVQCILPPYMDDFAGITLINRSEETVTAAQIESWVNTTLTVASTEPHPIFFFMENDFYSSDEGEDASLTLTITAVEFAGTWQISDEPERRIYKVAGTFSGKVRNAESEKNLTITAGRFVMEFSES